MNEEKGWHNLPKMQQGGLTTPEAPQVAAYVQLPST